MMVAIIWMIPCIERMPPIDLVDMANPPVNLNGRDGGVSDLGILRSTGKSCSAEIVWLETGISIGRKTRDLRDLLGKYAIPCDVQNYLLCKSVAPANGRFVLVLGPVERFFDVALEIGLVVESCQRIAR